MITANCEMQASSCLCEKNATNALQSLECYDSIAHHSKMRSQVTTVMWYPFIHHLNCGKGELKHYQMTYTENALQLQRSTSKTAYQMSAGIGRVMSLQPGYDAKFLELSIWWSCLQIGQGSALSLR